MHGFTTDSPVITIVSTKKCSQKSSYTKKLGIFKTIVDLYHKKKVLKQGEVVHDIKSHKNVYSACHNRDTTLLIDLM